MADRVDLKATQAEQNAPGLEEIEGDGWTIHDGRAAQGGSPGGFNAAGIEPLTYNNPYAQGLERVWFDGKVVYALDAGEIELEEAGSVKVAREYQCVYSVQLDERGKATDTEPVPGQLNIYDSIPGMEEYSPIWQFYYVEVPRDYQANTLRSIEECDRSGYPIRKSNDFEN